MDNRGYDLERQIAGIATLDEPVRRQLYLYVVDQGHGVTRDEAAEALGIEQRALKSRLHRGRMALRRELDSFFTG